MKTKNIIAVVGSIFLFINCSKEEVGNEIAYDIILENSLSYSDDNQIPKQFKVFENDDDWNNFIPEIERVNPTRAEALKNLNFDFSNHNLIFVIGEFHNYCCTKIVINRVYKLDNLINVDFEESGPGNVAGAALSQSYLILKIQKDK